MLNVRGLNRAQKRRQVFRWLHGRKFQVIFLQEVYSSSDLEKIWLAEWGGKVIYCHGSKHSCGNLILLNPALDVKVESCETDQKGRQIVLHAKIDDTSFIFANIYAPNEPKLQLEFFKSLKVRLRKDADENLIIGGDMNCCLSPEDKRGGRPTEQKKQLIKSIHDLCNSFSSVDLWRKLHPNESHFTWQNNS